MTERGFYSRSFGIPWKIYLLPIYYSRLSFGPRARFAPGLADLWIESRVCYEVSHVRIIRPLSRLAAVGPPVEPRQVLRSLEPLYDYFQIASGEKEARSVEKEQVAREREREREIEMKQGIFIHRVFLLLTVISPLNPRWKTRGAKKQLRARTFPLTDG